MSVCLVPGLLSLIDAAVSYGGRTHAVQLAI